MKKVSLLILLILTTNSALSCTTFSFSDHKGNVVFGRNFDFPAGEGHIHFNQRNVKKVSFVQPPEKTFEWISKYGSITFNQMGKEFPYGGMNEAGLVIEQMWLEQAEYPQSDKRFGFTELQWIQYQLDNAATVKEVIDSDTLIRISYTSLAPLHFLVADAEGNVATIEYLSGKMIVHQGESLPYPVLSNCTYEHSLNYIENSDKKEQEQFDNWTVNSSGRFKTAALLIDNFSEEKNIINYSFDILDSVSQDKGTQWSIVYDITNREIHYHTRLNESIQKIKMNQFDFSCNKKTLFADISSDIKEKNSINKLNYEVNLHLIEQIVSSLDFLKDNFPKEALIYKAKYPETLKCMKE